MSLVQDALEEGCEQGVLIGQVQLCQQVLNEPVTPSEQLAALSIEELRQHAEQLQVKLLNR